MAVIQVKKYKIIKDENGNKIQVIKTKEEYNKETRNGTMTYYFADRYTINGKSKLYKSKMFALKREAEHERSLFLLDPIKYIQENSKKAKNNIEIKSNFNDEIVDNKTLDDYFEEFYEYDLTINKEITAYCHKLDYYKHVSPLLGKEIPNNINHKSIDYFHKEIDKKKLSYSKKVSINSVLSKLLDFLKNIKGIIEINYAKVYGGFKKPNDEVISIEKKIKYQSLDEFEFFMHHVEDKFWYAFFNFLFWHGIRKGEQQALRWSDINFEKELVVINKAISRNKNGGFKITNTKNRRTRIIYLATQSIEPLQKLYNLMSQLDSFNINWFVFGYGEELKDIISRNSIDRHLANNYTKLKELYPEKKDKIRSLTHHEFGRHSHASYLLNLGLGRIDIYDIIALRLGDTPEVIRSTYAHPYEDVNNDKTKELLN